VPGSARVSLVPDTPAPLPDFTRWPSFPFEGDIRVKPLEEPVDAEPPRKGEDAADCTACAAPDDAYIWVSDRWRVRAMDRPTGLPMVLILESRSHLDLGDLPNMLAAELGVMTVRLERAVRSLDGVARVHVNRWGDGEAHLHLWFMARPHGMLQLRGTFLSLWDEILPPVPEATWRENLALIAAWLAEFGGTPLAEPPRIDWKAPAKLESETALPEPSSNGSQEAEEADEPTEELTDPVEALQALENPEPLDEAEDDAAERVGGRIRHPVPGASAAS
jgi:diadenosine tetraphosphate (Ap4A) HIT family hydrolase